MTSPTGPDPVRACPRCGAALVFPIEPEGVRQPLTCQACQLVIPAAGLGEVAYLEDLQAWIGQRRAWLVDRWAAGQDTQGVPPGATLPGSLAPALDAGGAPFGAAAPTPKPPPSSPITAAGCLLATGVFALVAAGIAFTAFAWGSLGPWGRLSLLVVAGLACVVIGYRIAGRIRSTAAAVSVVGSLLLAVSAAFVLAQDDAAPGGVRVALVIAAAVLGLLGARIQHRRLAGPAALSALVSAGFVLIALVFAPAFGAVPIDSGRVWWAAAMFAVWGVGLLLLDLVDRMVSWSWFATGGLVVSALVMTGGLADALSDSDRSATIAPPTVAAVLMVSCLLLLALDRISAGRWAALPSGAVALLAFGSSAALFGVAEPSARPWLALVGVLAIGVALAFLFHLRARPLWRQQPVASPLPVSPSDETAPEQTQADVPSAWASAVAKLAPWLVALYASASVALVLAPWTNPPALPRRCAFTDCPPSPAVLDWLAASYPWWRGALVALVALLVGLLAHQFARRSASAPRSSLTAAGSLPPVMVIAIVSAWSCLLALDVQEYSGSRLFDAVSPAAIALLVIAGVGLVGLTAGIRSALWGIWTGAGLALVGISILWSRLEVDWVLAPEALGLLLAMPVLLAGMTYLLMREPEHVPTLASVGPALTLALLPPVWSVFGATAERWFDFSGAVSDQPSSAQLVRIVALLAVGAILTIVGARWRWAGVFWPGLITILVVGGLQLFEAVTLLPQWASLTVVGIALLVAGARWEWVRGQGRRGRTWADALR